jgi:hypothetical protein
MTARTLWLGIELELQEARPGRSMLPFTALLVPYQLGESRDLVRSAVWLECVFKRSGRQCPDGLRVHRSLAVQLEAVQK